MQCIDWKNENIEIYGSEASQNYGAIDIMAVPCHMGQLFWKGDYFVPPERECETD